MQCNYKSICHTSHIFIFVVQKASYNIVNMTMQRLQSRKDQHMLSLTVSCSCEYYTYSQLERTQFQHSDLFQCTWLCLRYHTILTVFMSFFYVTYTCIANSASSSRHCCAHYGQGTGQIWLDGFSCPSGAASFYDCIGWSWGSHNCHHSEDAGVTCTSQQQQDGGWYPYDGPLTTYVNLRVAHAPGMPGTFYPPPISKETAS